MNVIVLGGADNQLACVAAAKSIGADVIVVDHRSHLSGSNLADRWIHADVRDTRAILSALNGLSVAAVISDQSDYTAIGAAELSTELGVKGQDPDLVLACTNKLVMRERLANKVPDLIPNFNHFLDLDEAKSFISCRTAPVVVKPLQSQGSRGISLIENAADDFLIEHAFAESEGLGILVESAVFGEEYSVDAYVSQGIVSPLAISRKSQYPGNPCLDERLCFLPSHFIDAEEVLLDALLRVITALEIPFGIIHAEFIVGKSNVTLLEIALRGGGSGISSSVVPFLTNFDPVEALLRELLDLSPLPAPADFRRRSAILRFLPQGVRPQSRQNPELFLDGSLEVVLSDLDNQTGSVPASSADRHGYIIVGTDTETSTLHAESSALIQLGYPLGS